jgi:hypothetical protein
VLLLLLLMQLAVPQQVINLRVTTIEQLEKLLSADNSCCDTTETRTQAIVSTINVNILKSL